MSQTDAAAVVRPEWAPTEVVLADQSELANGWATPIPYNVVFVTAAVPADWPRTKNTGSMRMDP